MQKIITTTSIACVALYCLLQPITLNWIFGFLFAGIIPGTSFVLPFWAMCLLLASISIAAIAWLRRDMLFIGDEVRIEIKRKQQARAYVIQKTSQTKAHSVTGSIRQRLRRLQQTVSL